MFDDALRHLLHDADRSAAAAPIEKPQLAKRVRSTIHRRRQVRYFTGAIGAIAGVVILSHSLRHLPAPHPIAFIPPNPALRLEQIDRELAMREAGIQTMILSERLSRARAATLGLDSGGADEAVERAAAGILLQAGRLDHDPRLRAEARREYLDVVQRFPETASAARAKTKLDQLEKENRT